MSWRVYSFSDIKFVINHPQYGAYTINNQGVGEVGIDWSNDNSAHNVAADGFTMISKVKTENGIMAISCQQVSLLNDYLWGLFNTLSAPNAPSSLWAAANVYISEAGEGTNNITLAGVSFQKRPSLPFKAQGEMVTWNMMFAQGNRLGSVLAQINTNPNIDVNNTI